LSTSAAASPSPPSSADIRVALLIFVVTLVGCLALYAALTVPAAWFPAASTKSFGARDFAIARGSGGVRDGELLITAVDSSGFAIVSANTAFAAKDYPVIAWNASGFPDSADVRFLWRTEYAPSKLNSVVLKVESGRLAPVVMAGNLDWNGRITGVALAVHATVAEPLRVQGMDARAGGFMGQITDRFREWLAFEPWSGASINTITGGADVQQVSLPTFMVFVVALAAAIWLGFAWRRHRTRSLPVVMALLFIAGWWLLDVQWSINLARQVAQTRAQYGGKDWHDRHIASEDGPLFAFIEKVRDKLPRAPARVFVIADSAYFRGRAAYHLYPYNVFDPRNDTLPSPSSLHPGDYVLVYQRHGVEYNAQEHKLRFEKGEPVNAEAVLVEGGAALFRIL